MALFNYRYEKEYSFPWDTVSGRYYWTNIYFWESDYADPRDDPAIDALTTATAFCVGTAVRQERFRIERVAGGGAFCYEEIMGNNGALPGLNRAMLFNTVFISAGYKNSGWWFKRLRGCLRAGDFKNGQLSAFMTNYFQQNYVDVLASVPLTNYKRVPVGEMTISPKVHYWGLRNGTIRQGRPILRSC